MSLLAGSKQTGDIRPALDFLVPAGRNRTPDLQLTRMLLYH